MCTDKGMKKTRAAKLHGLLMKFDIVAIQETHLQFERTSRLTHKVKATHAAWHAPAIDAATGGVSLFVRHHLLGADAVTSCEILAEGRVMRWSSCCAGATLVIWNVHNYGLSHARASWLADSLGTGADRSLESLGRHLTVALGDWNCLAPEDRRLDYAAPSHRVAHVGNRGSNEWTSTLGRMLDIDHGSPTHFSRAGGTASRIDRIHMAVPGWMPLCTHFIGSTLWDPLLWDQKGWSDHVPVSCIVRRPSHIAKELQAIPSFVSRSKEFGIVVKDLLASSRLDLLPPTSALLKLKVIMRDASIVAMQMLLNAELVGDLSLAAMMTTAARLVWFGDRKKL
jgi:hypothetical protein